MLDKFPPGLIAALIFLNLLVIVTPCVDAYWLESKPESFSLRERENAPISQKNVYFTIQDNFDLFTDKINSPPLLLPNSDYFVPADIIDVNLPLFGVFSHPVKTVKDPIANLLYANLKIKKILDEYTEIQKKAEELLRNESLNSPEGKMNVSGNESEKPLDGEAQEESSIYEKLQEKSISLSTSNLNEINTLDVDRENNSQTPSTRDSLLSFQHLQKKAENPLPTSKLTTYKSSQNSKIITEENQSQSTSKYTTKNAPISKQDQNHYSGEITLPWLLDLPFKIFSYLLAHKIQALFIAFFCLMIINVVFGSRH
ncbi:MAG: hypothetical protein V1706_03465 [Pseudomonadota bacterium]